MFIDHSMSTGEYMYVSNLLIILFGFMVRNNFL